MATLTSNICGLPQCEKPATARCARCKLIYSSNLFQDVLPLKLSSTLLSPFGNEGKVSENDFIHAGGPSVSAVPLLTSAPSKVDQMSGKS